MNQLRRLLVNVSVRALEGDFNQVLHDQLENVDEVFLLG
jgi:hypothetical protein